MLMLKEVERVANGALDEVIASEILAHVEL